MAEDMELVREGDEEVEWVREGDEEEVQEPIVIFRNIKLSTLDHSFNPEILLQNGYLIPPNNTDVMNKYISRNEYIRESERLANRVIANKLRRNKLFQIRKSNLQLERLSPFGGHPFHILYDLGLKTQDEVNGLIQNPENYLINSIIFHIILYEATARWYSDFVIELNRHLEYTHNPRPYLIHHGDDFPDQLAFIPEKIRRVLENTNNYSLLFWQQENISVDCIQNHGINTYNFYIDNAYTDTGRIPLAVRDAEGVLVTTGVRDTAGCVLIELRKIDGQLHIIITDRDKTGLLVEMSLEYFVNRHRGASLFILMVENLKRTEDNVRQKTNLLRKEHVTDPFLRKKIGSYLYSPRRLKRKSPVKRK